MDLVQNIPIQQELVDGYTIQITNYINQNLEGYRNNEIKFFNNTLTILLFNSFLYLLICFFSANIFLDFNNKDFTDFFKIFIILNLILNTFNHFYQFYIQISTDITSYLLKVQLHTNFMYFLSVVNIIHALIAVFFAVRYLSYNLDHRGIIVSMFGCSILFQYMHYGIFLIAKVQIRQISV
jgi:hypothetical protein